MSSKGMGTTRDPGYKGRGVGFNEAWKLQDPIDDDTVDIVADMVSRPGGSIKLPKGWVAGMILRIRNGATSSTNP